jgi:NADP-dependent 3-hydroxy acid dehydrogenase YdfG
MTATWHNGSYPSIDPTRPENSVRGKSVIITGGSSGIGRETVRAFAAAGAASIAVLARRAELLEETKALVISEFPKVKIVLYGVDVSNEDQVNAAAREIGKWDILVMNAGHMSFPSILGSAKLEEWWKVWEVRF